MKENRYAKGVEKLVRPVDVGTLHFIQNFTGSLPKRIQRKMIQSSAKKTPLMGFVVEPYSFFLCYEIKDIKYAESLIPEKFKLAKTRVHHNDTPKYYGIFGIFNAHTSGFWGLRSEFYIIAEDSRTGLLSWLIVDYDTNTISYDPKNGLASANAEGSIFTIDYEGIIHIDILNSTLNRNLILTSDIKTGQPTTLDKRLWIEGNLSIGYGKELGDGDQSVFSLKFDPNEFNEALLIEKKNYHIESNTWYNGLLFDKPEVVLCFPYAQHFLSDSPGYASQIVSEEELLREVKKVDFEKINVFTTKPIKKMLLVGSVISMIVNLTLILLLIT